MRSLATAAWVVCVLASLLPSWLLIGLAGGRVATTSGALLLVGSGLGVAGAVLSRSAGSGRACRVLGVVVALLCAAAVAVLGSDGTVSVAGLLTFGGVAGVAALVAALLARPAPAAPH